MTLTPSERHAEQRCRSLAPPCDTCGNVGTVMVAVGPIDRLSGQPHGTVEAPCPACALGDFRAEIDALSRAALAPAPVTAEDFLPAAPRRKESPC